MNWTRRIIKHISSYCSINKKNENRLPTFGQRFQSLSDSFYSTILQDSKQDKIQIKNTQQLEHLTKSDYNDGDFSFKQPIFILKWEKKINR